jgi:pimeloyl-ACP methyl ester carboxylesterase
LAERISEAQIAIVEGAGHMVMLVRPTEVAKSIQRFLAVGRKITQVV